MAFQSTVSKNIGFGVVGEFFLDGPVRAHPGRLDSTDAANNVIGRAFTVKDDATASFETSADPQPLDVQAGGTGVFAGILATPKDYALYGTSAGGTLAASLALPNNTMVELVQECPGIIITLAAACAIGDWVWFNTTTGILETTAPAASAPAGTARVPNGRITWYESAAAGLAVMQLNAIA